LEAAAGLLKRKKTCFVLGNGFLRQPQAGRSLDALTNLLLLTAVAAPEASGIYFLAGENNHAGALHMGAVPGLLPGLGSLGSEDVRKRYENAWQASLSPDPGLDLLQMIEAAEEGRLRAMYILGENPLRTLPETARVRKALEGLDFLVVQDILDGETVRLADVVFSGAAFCEKAGTFTNLEGRIQDFHPVVPPPGHAKPDWEILDAVWVKLGGAPYEDVGRIRHEISRLIPMYRDVATGQGWVAAGTESGAIPFAPVAAPERPQVSDDFPLTAIFGSVRYHAGSGTRTSASPRIGRLQSLSAAMISPGDALSMGVKDGGRVVISSAVGGLETRVSVSKKIETGQVFLPAAGGDGAARALLRLQELCRGWNACPVRMEKMEKEASHETT
jgi:formate dehydrogenase alpha subunit